ncbi:MAG: CusA/CzcA family heavy metal efflux RND transporter [Rhodospirillaceae bacterium]|nr:CusA/CzcA family heavy metal efflux RND transporter [Rhodospirillaceae bacterium]
MIEAIVRWSLAHRPTVIALYVALTAWGIWAGTRLSIDAIPDLSDVQVVIRTSYPGQAPQIVENQVTYPLTTTLRGVPGAVTVRGLSMYGDSFIYVIFAEGTDLYWARTRVLEFLNRAAQRLPAGVTPALGPDATSVGWIYQYALIDRSGGQDIGRLRALQDWTLRFELQSVPGVAEVAAFGGMVRQYQITVDPLRLAARGLTLADVRAAVAGGNAEAGGAVIEAAEAEYMIRVTGLIASPADLAAIPLVAGPDAASLRLGDVADVALGPEPRRNVADFNGEGDAVGGVIVMRTGADVRQVVAAVEAKLDELRAGLPPGVEIVPTYNRARFIDASVAHLYEKLIEEMIVVALVCALFLFDLVSAAVVAASLVLGVIVAVWLMGLQGMTANIMSLGGIVVAVGAMVDAGIVLAENMHRKLTQSDATKQGPWPAIEAATVEVARPLFFSLVIVAVSFLPVLALEAQEGKLFRPLALTKTYAMAAAAVIAITILPILFGLLRGRRARAHDVNPVNRGLIAAYRPFIALVLRHPRATLAAGVVLLVSAAYPMVKLGGEFMPDIDEGDLLYMPSSAPAAAIGEMARILQTTDRLIKTVPEVATVHGKAGRAETATDPAPLNMIETVVQLKPKSEWRDGLTLAGLKAELNAALQLPGLANIWTMPIRNRVEMLSTGIKSPVGVKATGPDLARLGALAASAAEAIRAVPGAASVYAEKADGGRYLVVDVDRDAAARFGLNIADVQDAVAGAVGGLDAGEAIAGVERYAIAVRYPREVRDSIPRLRALPVATPGGAVTLDQVARVAVVDGPDMIRTENARPSVWIYADVAGRDIAGFVAEAKAAVAARVELPPGYALAWSGQAESIARAERRLALVIPAVAAVILALLFLALRRVGDIVLVLAVSPLSLAGGLWLLWALDYNVSIATTVGFIALAGVAVETAVLKLTYLNRALEEESAKARAAGEAVGERHLVDAVMAGGLLRVRPIVMTVATILFGLVSVMLGEGAGAEVMRRIAAPMVGGIAAMLVVVLAVLPAAFLVWKRRELKPAAAG